MNWAHKKVRLKPNQACKKIFTKTTINNNQIKVIARYKSWEEKVRINDLRFIRHGLQLNWLPLGIGYRA